MADAILSFPSEVSAWRRGANLAFRMLFDLKACSLDETGLFDRDALEDLRNGRPQRNYMAAYLAKLKAIGDPACELGFTAILTDHIASVMHAGEPCLENAREHYVRTPIPSEPAALEIGPCAEHYELTNTNL